MKKSLGFGKSTRSSKAVALAIGLAALTLLLIPYIYQYENVTKLMSDTKKIERESPADEGLCRRMCPERINRIYYDDEGAGLGHMKTIIRDLSELAGYLCAKLILPKPSKLLHIRHNFGQKLSDDLLWEDFINITFAGDNEPVIIRDECPNSEYLSQRCSKRNIMISCYVMLMVKNNKKRSCMQNDDRAICDIAEGSFCE